MKKLLAILLAAVMLLSSCGVSERNPAEQGGSESPTEQGSSEASGSEAGNGEIVTDVPKSTSDSVDTEAPDSAETAQTTNPFEGIFELDIYGHPLPELRELECALSYEEVCEMYPDKTVLTWLISYVDHTYATRRTQEINDYLVSLGKDYVVYFEPYIDNKYRDPHYVIIQDRINNGEKFDIIFEFSDFLGHAGLTIPDRKSVV